MWLQNDHHHVEQQPMMSRGVLMRVAVEMMR